MGSKTRIMTCGVLLVLLIAVTYVCFYAFSPQKALISFLKDVKKSNVEALRNSGEGDAVIMAVARFGSDHTSRRIVGVKTKGKSSTVTVSFTEPNSTEAIDSIYNAGLQDRSEDELYSYLSWNRRKFPTRTTKITYWLKKDRAGWIVVENELQREIRQAESKDAALVKKYLSQITLSDIMVHDQSYGTFRQYSITAQVCNVGEETFTDLVITVQGLNDQGKVVFEEPVWDMLKSKNLPPSGSVKLFLLMDDPPSDWNLKVTLKIDRLEIEGGSH